MKNKYFLILIFLILSGCDSKINTELTNKDKFLEDKTELTNRINSLEERITLLESQPKKQEYWILWKRTEWVDKTKFNNLGNPSIIDSFKTRDECFKSSQNWSIQNQRVISDDPRIITDGLIEVTYLCLPSSVELRPIRR